MTKSVLITGTSRGIGRATAELFAEKGWKVIAHARKETIEFNAFCEKIGADSIYFDMTDSAAMKSAVKDIIFNRKITVDALVNNAGTVENALFQMTPISRIRDTFENNLFSHMELTQLILKRMPKNGGSIVNVASAAGVAPRRGNSAYGVSKAAVIAWTQVLADELIGRVRVNAVAPGLSKTDMAAEVMKNGKAKIHDSEGIRMANPQEIANAIFFLSSEEASFVNGHILVVDGGIESKGKLYGQIE